MKLKTYTFSAIILLFGSSFISNAQNDTLTDIFPGINYGLSPVTGGGFVSGNNGYGDLAKMQLFDENYGVTGTGEINSILFAIPFKQDNGGSFEAVIMEDNNGVPGNVLGSKKVYLSTIDTAMTSFKLIKGGWLSNLNVKFDAPINIPSNNKFWVCMVLPNTQVDLVAVFSGEEGSFQDASTHVGEIWNDGTFHYFDGQSDTWKMKVSLAMFPTVTFGPLGTDSNQFLNVSVYPNPAQNKLNIKSNNRINSITIYDLSGKQVQEFLFNQTDQNEINISDLNSGMYSIRIEDCNGAIGNSHFEKL